MNRFADAHPIVLFIFYLSVLLVSMFTMHPVILIYSMIGAVAMFGMLSRPRVFFRNLLYYFLLFILIMSINPLFNHHGMTIMFFMNGRPITVEAVVYGVAIALMLVSVMFWCKNYIVIMTSDKFMYIFSKALPKLALVMSMTIRFIPLFQEQIKRITAAQKSIGLYTSKSRLDRLVSSARVYGSMLTWVFENSIHTADSMRSRGYGLPGRSSFSIFRFTLSDALLLCANLFLVAVFAVGMLLGHMEFYYYPVRTELSIADFTSPVAFSALALMLLPCVIQLRGIIRWKWLRSKISVLPIPDEKHLSLTTSRLK